jgi:signal transduction histidine kinase
VNLAGDGLAVALRGLAGNINRSLGIVCGADCSEAVFVQDYAVATHLYRIAQEAVQNALKHSNPTQILIRLSQNGDIIYLSITDNGLRGNEEDERDFGIGLNIIKFRANMVGGTLQVQRNAPNSTTISCVFQQKAVRESLHDTDFQLLGAKA